MHRLSLDEIKLICESLCDDDAACFAQTGERSRDAAFACFPRRGMKIMTEDACWTNVCRIIVQKRFSLRLCDHVHSIARLEWARANGATLIVREGAAVAMARAGHLKVLQHAYRSGVVSLDIKSASAAAASMGHLSTLQWMHSDPLRESDLGVETLCKAAEGGHLEVLEWIHSHGCGPKVPEAGCKVACAAAKAGQLKVLQWIYDDLEMKYLQEWKTPGHDACESAAEHGQLDALRWLAGRKCHGEFFSAYLEHAARGGSLPVVIFTWETCVRDPDGGPHSWDRDSWRAVYEVAAEGGHMEVFQFLAVKGLHLEMVAPTVFEAAARSGNLALVQWMHSEFLDLRPMRPFAGEYTRACKGAAGNGHLHILQWLRSVGLDWHRDMGTSMVQSGRPGEPDSSATRLSVLKWAVENGYRIIDIFMMCHHAASEGNLPMLQFLLTCPVYDFDPGSNVGSSEDAFPSWSRCDCETAAREGHVYILEWVLKQPWADRVNWSDAANTAAGRGRLFVLQWLYANSTRQMVDWGRVRNHVCGNSDPVMAGRIHVWLRKG